MKRWLYQYLGPGSVLNSMLFVLNLLLPIEPKWAHCHMYSSSDCHYNYNWAKSCNSFGEQMFYFLVRLCNCPPSLPFPPIARSMLTCDFGYGCRVNKWGLKWILKKINILHGGFPRWGYSSVFKKSGLIPLTWVATLLPLEKEFKILSFTCPSPQRFCHAQC